MRIRRSRKIKFLQGFNHDVELFNHGVELFFNADIKNFLTIKSSIKWVFINYLKVLVVSSPLLILSISYLIG